MVLDDLLKNKSIRYYFSESLNIGRDMVYLYPLDRKVERGEIEESCKPVIRFGIHVFNARGKNWSYVA